MARYSRSANLIPSHLFVQLVILLSQLLRLPLLYFPPLTPLIINKLKRVCTTALICPLFEKLYPETLILIYLFIADVCDMYTIEEHMQEHEVRKLLYNLGRVLYKKKTARNFLQRLGVMHLVATVGVPISSQTNLGITKRFNNPEEVQDLEGLPADFAFTIFHLFFPVHYYMKYKNQHVSAALLSDYILKNYAYKLHGVKRIAFMANFFASLHYDYLPTSPLNAIKDIGEYVVSKFDGERYVNAPENRIYTAFMKLIMADIQMQTKNVTECENLIKSAKLNQPMKEEYLESLWTFLRLYCDMITKNATIQGSNRRHIVMDSQCHPRWRKAIVACSLHDRHDRQSVEFVARWSDRMGKSELDIRHILHFQNKEK